MWSYALASAAATAPAAPAPAPLSPASTLKAAHATAHSTEEDQGLGGGALQSVQWVFDARGVTVPPLFEVGTTVWVTDVTKSGVVERHPLLAVVKSTPCDPTGNCRVKLKYHNTEVTVKEVQLLALSEHVPDDDLVARDEVPSTLCILLLLAGLQQTGKAPPALPNVTDKSPVHFSISEPGLGDRKEGGTVHLCRQSLFHQLRSLAVAVEAKWGDAEHQVTHPVVGEHVDAQLAYGENVLNWIVGRFGVVVDTLELQRRCVEWALSVQSGASDHAQAERAAAAAATEAAAARAARAVEDEAQAAKAQQEALVLARANAEAQALLAVAAEAEAEEEEREEQEQGSAAGAEADAEADVGIDKGEGDEDEGGDNYQDDGGFEDDT